MEQILQLPVTVAEWHEGLKLGLISASLCLMVTVSIRNGPSFVVGGVLIPLAFFLPSVMLLAMGFVSVPVVWAGVLTANVLCVLGGLVAVIIAVRRARSQ